MVKQIGKDDNMRYRCEECRFVYVEQEWAEKCEAWCKEHQSCNLEIIQHGQPPAN